MQESLKLFYESPPGTLAEHRPVKGRLKVRPEDFEVREVALREPEGSGEHLYCWIEKVNLSTPELLGKLSRGLGVQTADLGIAGMKDKRARTFQWISIPRSAESRLGELTDPSFKVHRRSPHPTRLRRGQLAGNRFRIRVRDVAAEEKPALVAGAEALAVAGVPNYFGRQRFGNDGGNLETGLALLKGKRVGGGQMVRQLAVHSVQSLIFNMVLGERVREGLARTVLKGDVLLNLTTGMPVVARDLPREQERLEQGIVGISGPLMGGKMRRARDEVARREAAALASLGISPEDFEGVSRMAPGARRLYWVGLSDLQVEWEEEDPVLEFGLPPGSYATTVFNELLAPA